MGDITKLLDQTQLDTATDGQKALLADIRALLALLLDEKNDKDKAREEFERLSQWKKEIENLIRAERGEKRESDRVANKEKTIADLQAKIKALEAVIKEEKAIVAATQAARADAVQRLARIGGDQEQTRQKVEAVANQIAKEAGDERGPFEPKPTPMPAANAPAEGAKPNETPSATQPAAATEAAPVRSSEPGEKPLAQAVANQRQAEANLQQAKGKAAQQEEETAVANLE